MDERLTRLFGDLLLASAGDASSVRPEAVDALVAVVKESARYLLRAAIDAECRHLRERGTHPDGNRRGQVVRNGYHPERSIVTGIGTVPVRLPKLRGRNGATGAFRSVLVPRYARRARALDADSAALYVQAIATGEINRALAALVGPPAFALPPPIIRELGSWWREQCRTWREAAPRCSIDAAVWSVLANSDRDAAWPGLAALRDLTAPGSVATDAYTKIDRPRRSIDSPSQTRPFGEGD